MISFFFLLLSCLPVGGLGIPYRPWEEDSLPVQELADLVCDVFDRKCQEYGLDPPPRMAMEPGRYLVGDAGFLIGEVQTIKRGFSTGGDAPAVPLVGTNIGMNVLARPAMYQAYHHIYFDGYELGGKALPHGFAGLSAVVPDVAATQQQQQQQQQEEEGEGEADRWRLAGICGQLCENTDFWCRERMVPSGLQAGDLVVVADAGAYGFSMSYQYNGRLRPAECLIFAKEQDGVRTHSLIRPSEKLVDLVRDTHVPAGLQSALEQPLSKVCTCVSAVVLWRPGSHHRTLFDPVSCHTASCTVWVTGARGVLHYACVSHPRSWP